MPTECPRPIRVDRTDLITLIGIEETNRMNPRTRAGDRADQVIDVYRSDQMTPRASIASATRVKPAMFAPAT